MNTCHHLLPVPKRYTAHSGELELDRPVRWKIAPGLSDARLETALRRLSEELESRQAATWRMGAATRRGGGKALPAVITIPVSGLPADGYRLRLQTNRWEIAAVSPAAAFHALQTLRQLILGRPTGGILPCLEIEDWPDFPVRGVMLDISRCRVPTMETLRRLTDLLAGWKINQLQLYTEHTFAFTGHEIVWGESSPMTGAQIEELDQYCHDRFIELTPNFNSFGHWDRWLKHPEYRTFAESPDGFVTPWGWPSPHGGTLFPNAASLDLLDGLYGQLLPHFRSQRFNIGCDETWELGQGRSRELCAARGKHKVYADFLLQVAGLAFRHGRAPQFWADILLEEPALVASLPPTLTALVWGYEANHPFAEQNRRFAETGVPFYVCPGTSSWNSLGGRLTNALGNLTNAARTGAAHGAAGYLITDWGDGGHHQPWPVSYPGFAAGASLSWNSAADPEPVLGGHLSRHIFRDSTDRLAEALLGIGRLRDLFAAATPNRHPLNNLLFAANANSLEAALRDVTAAELEKCLHQIEDSLANIDRAAPQAIDGEWLRREVAMAARLLQLAARRGLLKLSLGPTTVADLRRAWIPLLGDYETLWLLRHRPGGLHESSDRLRAALAFTSGVAK